MRPHAQPESVKTVHMTLTPDPTARPGLQEQTQTLQGLLGQMNALWGR